MRTERITLAELNMTVPDGVQVELDHARRCYVATFGGVTYVAEFDLRTAVA